MKWVFGSMNQIPTIQWVIFRGANFRGKSEKALKLIFVVLNFVTATSPGDQDCTSDDVINTSTRSRLQSSLLLSHTCRLGQIA